MREFSWLIRLDQYAESETCWEPPSEIAGTEKAIMHNPTTNSFLAMASSEKILMYNATAGGRCQVETVASECGRPSDHRWEQSGRGFCYWVGLSSQGNVFRYRSSFLRYALVFHTVPCLSCASCPIHSSPITAKGVSPNR